MRLCLTPVLCLAAAALCAAGTPDKQKGTDMQTLVKDGNQFAVDLYGQLAKKDGNLFFSPYSISSALAMTYNGARGATAKEMAKTLHFDLPADRLNPAFASLNKQIRGDGRKRLFDLNVANALWAQKDFAFQPQFVQANQKYYGAGLQKVDFANAPENARGEINRWVENETRRKIKDLIPEGVINPDTRLVLTNAIYFKAAWDHEFSERTTKPMPFTTAAGKKANVPMMSQVHKDAYFENESLQMLALPYQAHELSLIVLLPKQANGLAALEKSLSAENLAAWLGNAAPHVVTTYLPKFKTTAQFKMKDVLSQMGMGTAFTANADFSGISTQDRLKIQEVIHKAYIDLNEKGTEAAAATAVVVGLAGAAPQKLREVTFRADHPFVYVIRDNVTGSVLFMGRLSAPE